MSEIFWIGFRLPNWNCSYVADSHERYEGEAFQERVPVDSFKRSIQGQAGLKLGDGCPSAFNELEIANVSLASSLHWVNSNWVADQLREGLFALGSIATFPGSKQASLGLNLPVADFDWLFPGGFLAANKPVIEFECEFREVEEGVARVLRYNFGGREA